MKISNTIHESVSVAVGYYFEFIEPVWLPGISMDSSKIKLKFDPKNSKRLIGFFIETGVSEKKAIEALKTASRLSNYLSLKTGLYVYHKLPLEMVDGKVQIPKKGGIDSNFTKLQDLDFTNSSFCNLMHTDSQEN